MLSERSVVYDRFGRILAVFRAVENRKAVSIDAVPKLVIDAIVAVEDADFFEHRGVNLRRTIGALSANVEAGGVEQGGSTITQQLVKQGLLTSEQNLTRKIAEARLAWELEKRWTKQQILERYLNSVYFGQGAYGVEAAANHYFGVPIGKVDVAQAAFLAGMIRNPVGYDPTRFRERSRTRRAVVLRRMVSTGVLTPADADRWALAPMPRPKEVDEPLPSRTSSKRSSSACSTTLASARRRRTATTRSSTAACASTRRSTRACSPSPRRSSGRRSPRTTPTPSRPRSSASTSRAVRFGHSSAVVASRPTSSTWRPRRGASPARRGSPSR